jgi:hypothetical protein
MSLPPKYSGHRIAGTSSAEHTLELFLDYVCPFSAKIWKQVYHHIVPWLEQAHPGKVQVGVNGNVIDLSVGQFPHHIDLLCSPILFRSLLGIRSRYGLSSDMF